MNRADRGIVGASIWRKAYWLRQEPGRIGFAIYLSIPALFFLPIPEGIFGPLRRSTVQAFLILISSIALGARLGGGRSQRTEDHVWLSQKGVSLGDVSVEDWILDLIPLAALSVWWGLTAYLASVGEGWSPLGLVAVAATAFLISLLVRTLVGFLSAVGYPGGADLAVGLVVVSILLQQVAIFLPPAAGQAIRWGALPISKIGEAIRALLLGDLAAAAPDLLHTLAVVGLLLWATYWKMERWRPSA